MPARFPIAKMLALGVGTSAVAVGQALLGPGALAAVTEVGVGLLHFFLTKEADRLLGDDSPSPESLIQNHDLRLLVGEAIADTMRRSAGHGPGKADAAETIEQLADGAPKLWSNIATAADIDYADFDEQSVSELFAHDATNFQGVEVLDPTVWRGFLDSLNAATEAGAEDALLDSLANRLHKSVAEMLRGKLKQDFTGETSADGRGFASLNLMLMGRLTAGVEKLLEQSSGETKSTELLAELKTFNEKLPAEADQQFGRLGDQEKAAFSSILEQIKQIGPRIETRLSELTRAVAKLGEVVREGNDHTHERLAKIEALLHEVMAPKEIGKDPTERKLPPELLDAARELLGRGDQHQQAVAKIALSDHKGADQIIQDLKRGPLAEAFRLLTLEGNNWYNAGQFDRAVEPYEQALALNPREVNALNNAAIAHNQARHGSIADHQLRAIELLEKAASEAQQNHPIAWAGTQNNLGLAYSDLPTGERSENLTRAIRAYESALEVYTRKVHPAEWAITQSNLGTANKNLPTGDRNENLTRAIRAHESALEVLTRDAHPVSWAGTQNDLGLVYWNLPTGDRNENLTRAIRAYELALEVFTRKAHPVDWAGTQNNLGAAYMNLPTGVKAENCSRSIRAYKSALEVLTHEAHPVAWASTQYNLAISLVSMASVELEHKCDWLEKAIATGKAALTVSTAEAFPREYTETLDFLQVVRVTYEAVECAEKRPFDEIAPAD